MAKLIKCPTCGNQVSSDCKKCVHCGGKIKKKSSGCAIVFVVAAFVILFAYMSLPKPQEPSQVNYDSKPQEVKQTKPFSETTARSMSKVKLEKVLEIKTKIRYPEIGTCKKLSEKTRKKMGAAGDLYEVEYPFEILNFYNVWVKYQCRAVVEFLDGKGYRVWRIYMDDKQIFPML